MEYIEPCDVVYTGPSLVWVAILGVVIIYIYSLAGFAFLRDVFNPANHAYCASLTQCFVTVVRYGLIGDYDEDVRSHHSATHHHHLVSTTCL